MPIGIGGSGDEVDIIKEKKIIRRVVYLKNIKKILLRKEQENLSVVEFLLPGSYIYIYILKKLLT